TKPAPTGSPAFTNTIGTLRVACWNAAVASLPPATTTSGASAISSTAYCACGWHRLHPSDSRCAGWDRPPSRMPRRKAATRVHNRSLIEKRLPGHMHNFTGVPINNLPIDEDEDLHDAATLPPEVRPETGRTNDLPVQFHRTLIDYYTKEPTGT